ncbi:MAG: L-threonylcarbamoyladenylate synthase [Bryobacteraceae bacterium]
MARAADLIRQGGLVAFPTETVYGLGANAFDAQAVQRIYEAKGRPSSSPLIVHVADEAMAKSISAEWPGIADVLAARFWPGPLTLVVKKASAVPDSVTAGLDSVGVRVPSHPVALDLIRRAGVPIAAPSANRFMQISPTTAEHVRTGLGDRVDMILDGGPTQVGIESTVVALTREPPVVLRPGMISQADLEAATALPWRSEIGSRNSSESPGMHPRHYAPRTPFYILERGERPPAGSGRVIHLPADPSAYAAALYAELHEADAKDWDWIAIEKPPDKPEWAGILDRIQRAATRKP